MANQTYSLALTYSNNLKFAQNVWHYQFDDAGFVTTKAAAEALAVAWNTANLATMRSILPAGVNFMSYSSQCVSQVGGFTAFTPIPATPAGLRTGQSSASGLCPCIIHYPTNLTLGRGRTFLPQISEDDIEDGIYTQDYIDDVALALTTLFDPITLVGGGGPTAIFGYFRRPSKVFVALTDSRLSMNLGTQRRRMKP